MANLLIIVAKLCSEFCSNGILSSNC